jgi:hypothetical protein
MGIMVGVLIKYEIDIMAKKKRMEERMSHIKKAKRNDSTLRQYDDILVSMRSVNKSLADIQVEKQRKKKEV